MTQVAVVSALAAGTVAYVDASKTVDLDVQGKASSVHVFGGTVGSLLADRGVRVGPRDLVSPALDSRLEDGEQVVVRYAHRLTVTQDGVQKVYWTTASTVAEALDDLGIRADGAALSASRSQVLGRDPSTLTLTTPKAVRILVDGKTLPLTTTARTVAQLLGQAKVSLRPADQVSVPTASPVVAGLSVAVTRIDKKRVTQSTTVAQGTTEQRSDALFVGQRRTLDAGHAGTKVLTFDDTLANGALVGHALVAEQVTAQPVNRTVQVGTKQRPAAAASSSGSRAVTGGGGRAGGLNWAALAQCESGGNPRIVSSSGAYHGLYQFSNSTWHAVGGSGSASQASASEQTARAQALYNRAGAGQWPVCGRNLFR